MLELTARTYEEEARTRGIPVQVSEMGTFAGRDGLHIRQLEEAGVPAVVFGKALYEGRISLHDLSQWI